MIPWLKDKSVRQACAGRFLVAAAVALAAVACRPEGPVQLYGEAQGTYYSIQYFDSGRRNLQPQVDSLLDAFDLSASLWVDSSLLRRLNANETDSVDDILATLLEHSQEVCRYSGGAFDVRIGRLVQAWGFSFKTREEPDSAMLATLLEASRGGIGIDSNNHVSKENPATELDFNAIAQGYAVDLLASMFDSLGIESYLIDVGGEVTARGCKPGGKPWRVGIERPAADRYSAPVVMTAVELRDGSLVTSGSYRKYYEKDGQRYSHTIDPATGRPVTHSLLSASVVEKECWMADAMATAYMVMGLEKAKAFIASHSGQPGTGAVMFIYDNGGQLETYATPQFQSLQTKTR
ncbi:MAG: FAD:protein FMN transferase [Bacteroidales bacterium]|nr:FAD:protein FMN transferase [Bacteroidales bacterium]